MTTTFRISEIAERSGFSPTTLRYYEDIGLLPEPARTPSGYRAYDERTLETLAFIARAKQLGCSLEEIGELSSAFDGGECGPVQDRLSEAVEAKITEAQAQIATMMTFTAELQAARASLSVNRPDGPCDDSCGCKGSPERAPIATAIPLIQAEATVIACSLDAGSMDERLGDWRSLIGEDVRRVAIEGGVRLEFPAGTDLARIVGLAEAEQSCCRFFSFAITVDERGVGLEVRAPDDAAEVVHGLFAVPA